MLSISQAQLAEVTADDGSNSELAEKHAADNAERRDLLEAAVREDLAQNVDLDETRPLRAEIEKRYPGTRASQVLAGFLDLDSAMRADPVEGGHRVAEYYSRKGRFGKPKDEPKIDGPFDTVGRKLPGGAVRYVHEGTIEDDIVQAMRQTENEAGEEAELRKINARLRERDPDAKLSDTLERFLDFDAAATENPYKAAAKLAARYGMPLDDSQAAAQSFASQREAEYRQVVESDFPELKGREAEVRELVISGGLSLTDDVRAFASEAASALNKFDAAIRTVSELRANNPDFDSYRPLMSAFLDTGRASSVAEAYKLAKKHSLRDSLEAAFGTPGR